MVSIIPNNLTPLQERIDFGAEIGQDHITTTREAAMAATRQAEAVLLPKSPDRKLSGIGATEDQMNVRGAIPQRIDKKGTKIEDMAGTGEHDGSGG